MFKSQVLFSLALGGLVLAGCNKDENPTPVAPPPATTSAPTTAPSTEPLTLPTIIIPTSSPTSAPGALLDSAKPAVADAEKKASNILGTIEKSAPATNPITDANK